MNDQELYEKWEAEQKEEYRKRREAEGRARQVLGLTVDQLEFLDALRNIIIEEIDNRVGR